MVIGASATAAAVALGALLGGGVASAAPGPSVRVAVPITGDVARATAPTQIITVSSAGYASTYANLSGWQLVHGTWTRVLGPFKARIGSHGFSTMGIGKRRQNTGTTPVGSYGLTQGFGLRANPGTRMPWIKVTPSFWWPYDRNDPKTYNLLQTRRTKNARWSTSGSLSEHLSSYKQTYQLAFVINFNLPKSSYVARGQRVTKTPADTSAGGGIFLHVNGASATAGCVSVSARQLVRIARWLRPGRNPQITMGPAPVVRKLTPFGRT